MKVLQVPYGFYPDPVGGTEVYVAALSRHLQELGLQIVVAAPGKSDDVYQHEDLLVRRYAVGQVPTLDVLYGRDDPAVSRAFGRVLEEQHPDIVHLHAYTRGTSLSAVREAKRRHMPIVFTYHTPTVSCQRGTLMRWGREVCDGYVDLGRCTRCVLQDLELPQKLAYAVGSVPVRAGDLMGAVGLSGGIWTALRMRQLVDVRSTSFHAFMRDVDHVIAVSQWVKSVLLINRVPREKITLSRHGLNWAPPESPPVPLSPRVAGTPLRRVFLGRMKPAKGLHVLIHALARIPNAPIELHVYGLTGVGEEDRYRKYVGDLIQGDPRIIFRTSVPNIESVTALRDYDLLAVPSQGLETGPLVILEAFAAGIPVIGSDLGGIAELVEHDVNGLLLPPGSVEGWTKALLRVVEEPLLLNRLRNGVQPPRKMHEVAVEMVAIYGSLVKRDSATSRPAILRESV